MPLPPDSWRIAIEFTLGGTQESGVFTLGAYREHNAANQTDNVSETQIIADKLALKFRARWPLINSVFSAEVRFTRLKVYSLGVDGRANAIGQAALSLADGSPMVGTAGGNSLPYEVAVAVTTYGFDPAAFTPLPRRKRGRFYLPPPAASSMGVNGRLQDGVLLVIADWAQALLQDFDGTSMSSNELPGADEIRLAVLSKTGNLRSRLHTVSVGNVPDVQRRRREDQREARYTRALGL